MTIPNAFSRRQFVQLGTLAAGATWITSPRAAAAEATGHQLPKLPYAPAALEPHIDTRTMEIHHGKHHAAYVAGLNTALQGKPDLASQPLESLLASLPDVSDDATRTAIRNHGGGHWNHTFFWELMAPPSEISAKAPSGTLLKAIDAAFGSFDEFKKLFAEASMKRFGSGWAWLVSQNGKLKITSTPNQDNPFMKGIVPDADLGTPVLGIDVWEHAYYLHYQNRRADYITAWWNVVNWPAISQRFASPAKP